ncbi:MAG: hypothetical protein ACKVU2_08655 [Saprospiraceae bacterium]
MNTSFKVLILFAVVLLGIAAASSGILAGGSVKVQVVNAKGKPVPGETVLVFKRGEGLMKCKCQNGICVPAAEAMAVTAAKGARGATGVAEFTNLMPSTDFVACINFKCTSANNQPCQNDQNCGFNAGVCVPFTTDKKGNAPAFKINKP